MGHIRVWNLAAKASPEPFDGVYPEHSRRAQLNSVEGTQGRKIDDGLTSGHARARCVGIDPRKIHNDAKHAFGNCGNKFWEVALVTFTTGT